MNAIILHTSRDGYAPSQCGHTLTVGQLLSVLEDLAAENEDTPVFFSNDNGYTYGRLRWESVEEQSFETEDEE